MIRDSVGTFIKDGDLLYLKIEKSYVEEVGDSYVFEEHGKVNFEDGEFLFVFDDREALLIKNMITPLSDDERQTLVVKKGSKNFNKLRRF